MEQNVGLPDRLVRLAFVMVTIVACLKGWLKGKAGLLLVVAGALLSSVISGYCPLYEQLGMSTNEPKKTH